MCVSDSNTIQVITLSAELEKLFSESLTQTPEGLKIILAPQIQQGFYHDLTQILDYCWREGYQRTALLCDPRIRQSLHRLIERPFPRLSVLSYAEIANGFQIEVIHTLN